MDAYMTFMSCIFAMAAVIIYEVGCADSAFYGHNNNSWSFQTEQRAWFNSSSPVNQISSQGAIQTSPFNISQNIWPSLRIPQASQLNSTLPDHRNSSRSRNRNKTQSHFFASGLRNNTNSKKNKTRGPSKYSVSDDELREFAEEIFGRDINNAGEYVSTDYQGKTTSSSKDDKAPDPLLTVHNNVNQIPTISKLKRLHNNYISNVNQNEQVTAAERQEEEDLINAFLDTDVMEYTRKFLVEKGAISNDPAKFKDKLKEIWFTLYPRSNGRLGSSGFEHIFLGEIKGNDVSGLHNWVYFHSQEQGNNLNYLGYLKIVELGGNRTILKLHFTFLGVDKPVDSIFVGTSPELEMAVYSTCFLLRPDQVCPLQFGGKRFIVRAYTFHYNGKELIGSAFPEI